MKCKVQVADKVTGAERTIIIDSLSREDASNQANAQGFLVSSVESMADVFADAMPQPGDALPRYQASVRHCWRMLTQRSKRLVDLCHWLMTDGSLGNRLLNTLAIVVWLLCVAGSVFLIIVAVLHPCSGFLAGCLGVLLLVGVFRATSEAYRQSKLTPEQRAREMEWENEAAAQRDSAAALQATRATIGEINPQMICPHCQAHGQIRTKIVERKKGVSGAKATGAILTGGFSLLATGLSRKEHPTQAHCDNCNNTWEF